MRLAAMRITVNRKGGIAHWLVHEKEHRSKCWAAKDYVCSMFKPYPADRNDRPWFKMIERWNAANPS
jgi:hypothetical protein